MTTIGRQGVFLLQLENQIVDFAGGDRIESRCGLIEKQDFRLQRQRACQTHSFLHASGNITRHLVEIAVPCQRCSTIP